MIFYKTMVLNKKTYREREKGNEYTMFEEDYVTTGLECLERPKILERESKSELRYKRFRENERILRGI